MAASKISLSKLKPGRVLGPLSHAYSDLILRRKECQEGLEVTMNELNGFDVARSNNHFKICNSVVVAIRLNEFRKMVEVPAVANPIPTEMFRF
ncbi:hypothetical protein YC2023_018846 [Brassica napus]